MILFMDQVNLFEHFISNQRTDRFDSIEGHCNDLFPYFLRHAKEMYPHLTCMEDLKKISDLRDPANWYPDARLIKRKIIFHAGPTNSGKVILFLSLFIKDQVQSEAILDLSCITRISQFIIRCLLWTIEIISIGSVS